MTTIPPTVLDISRAIVKLDAVAGDGSSYERGCVTLVASNLAYQFSKHNGWGGRKNVTSRDVRYALMAHGASTFTIEQCARTIASQIRADFTDGMLGLREESNV